MGQHYTKYYLSCQNYYEDFLDKKELSFDSIKTHTKCCNLCKRPVIEHSRRPLCNIYYEDFSENDQKAKCERCHHPAIYHQRDPKRYCKIYIDELLENKELLSETNEGHVCNYCGCLIGSHSRRPEKIQHLDLLKKMLKKKGVPLEDLVFETQTDNFPFSVGILLKWKGLPFEVHAKNSLAYEPGGTRMGEIGCLRQKVRIEGDPAEFHGWRISYTKIEENSKILN